MSPNTRSSVRVRLGFGRRGSKTGGILSPEDVEDTAQKAGNEGRTTQKAGDAGETALGAGDVNRATWKGQLSTDQTGRSAQEDGLEAVMAGSQVGQTTEEPSWRRVAGGQAVLRRGSLRVPVPGSAGRWAEGPCLERRGPGRC